MTTRLTSPTRAYYVLGPGLVERGAQSDEPRGLKAES